MASFHITPPDPYPIGTRGGGGGYVDPDIQARWELMNTFKPGINAPAGEQAVAAAPLGPSVMPDPEASKAASVLGKIFAPAASQAAPRPSVNPLVSYNVDPNAAPVVAPAAPVAEPESPAPSGGEPMAGGRGGGWRGIDSWLETLMRRLVYDSGMGEELLSNLKNQATQTSKNRERDRILRRSDEFAARGLFGSGLRKDAVMGIEGEESVALQSAINEIEFQNAQMIQQGLRDSISVLNAMIAKKLGQGNLNIQREQLALEQAKLALQESMFRWQQYLDKLGLTNPIDTGDDGESQSGGGGGGGGGPATEGSGGRPWRPSYGEPADYPYGYDSGNPYYEMREKIGNYFGNSGWDDFSWGGGGVAGAMLGPWRHLY